MTTSSRAAEAAGTTDQPLPGHYPEPGALAAAVKVLEHVESLPVGATGALGFEGDGVIVVDGRRICWALAPDMRQRMSDLLCEASDPPLPRHVLKSVLRRCKENGTSFGQALLASGLVSESQLSSALVRHNAEAIWRLAQGRARPTSFSNHSRSGFDRRFSFSTAELLAAVGVEWDHESATAARHCLSEVRVDDATGFAFVRDEQRAAPLVIAVDRGCPLFVGETLEISRWLTGMFDVAADVEARTSLIAATWCSRTSVVGWRIDDVRYAAVCSSRPASALLVSQLAHRLQVGGMPQSGAIRVRS